jgi:hypothetical protein
MTVTLACSGESSLPRSTALGRLAGHSQFWFRPLDRVGPGPRRESEVSDGLGDALLAAGNIPQPDPTGPTPQPGLPELSNRAGSAPTLLNSRMVNVECGMWNVRMSSDTPVQQAAIDSNHFSFTIPKAGWACCCARVCQAPRISFKHRSGPSRRLASFRRLACVSSESIYS